MIETIDNTGGIGVTVSIIVMVKDLCSHTNEPQIGSTITWKYVAWKKLLAINSLRQWPASKSSEAIDLETLTYMAADEASNACGVSVTAYGVYILKDGTIVTCEYSGLMGSS